MDFVNFVTVVWQIPNDFQLVDIFHRNHLNHVTGVILAIWWWLAVLWDLVLFVLDAFEFGQHHFLKIVDTLVAGHAKRHDVRRVILVEELDHLSTGLWSC